MNWFFLYDPKTKFFFMPPGRKTFTAFTKRPPRSMYSSTGANVIAIAITEDGEDCPDSFNIFSTILINAGFTEGYLDGQLIQLDKNHIFWNSYNTNEMVYAQYLLTHDMNVLAGIQKKSLYCLCRVKNATSFELASITLGDKSYILGYTTVDSIPASLKDKYPDYAVIHCPLDNINMVINSNSEAIIDAVAA